MTLTPFPSAFAGVGEPEKKASDSPASSSARTVYDALYEIIAPNIARAIAEWERGR